MRILYLSQLIPYPIDAGPKVRAYHVLQYLAAAGHQISLVAFCRPNDTAEQIDHLRQYCDYICAIPMNRSQTRNIWQLAMSLATGRPFLIGRDALTTMHRRLRRLLSCVKFDAIHADQLWMAQYALAAKSGSRSQTPIRTVLDQHNAVYLIPERLAAGETNPVKRAILALEARKLVHYEVETCRQFDQVVWVTNEDRSALARVSNGQRPSDNNVTIPICIDPQAKARIKRSERARRVTFLGGLHWPPNAAGIVSFAREVWPQVQQQVPDAILTIIGKNPPAELSQQNGNLANLEVTGYVTDPTPYLQETAAFIVPLDAGGGMRVKILDAWSWGLPVVSTRIGAEGIHYQDGENLLIADHPEAFGSALTRLLQEPALAARVGEAGRHTVERYYDWRRIYPAWDSVYTAQR